MFEDTEREVGVELLLDELRQQRADADSGVGLGAGDEAGHVQPQQAVRPR